MGWEELPYWETKEIISSWWRNAGAEARKEMLKNLQKIRLPSTDVYKCDTRFATDRSNDLYSCGGYHVYAWVTKRCSIMYIGYGDSWRAANPQGRNEEFQKKFETNEIKSFVLCSNVNKDDAQQMETLCIWRAMVSGYQLTNKSKILSPQQIIELRAEREGSLAYEKYQTLMDAYPDVVEAFDKLKSYCLDMVLSEESVLEDDVHFKSRSRDSIRKYVKYVWTIDGVTKPAIDWCKKYNFALSRANQRIECYGCTPKEAITFPNLPRELYKKKPIDEWWHENGYVPGTDTTSYVTPREEWGEEYAEYGD